MVDDLRQVLEMHTYRLDLQKSMPNQPPVVSGYDEGRYAPALSQAPISGSRERLALAAYTAQRTAVTLRQEITEAPQPQGTGLKVCQQKKTHVLARRPGLGAGGHDESLWQCEGRHRSLGGVRVRAYSVAVD